MARILIVDDNPANRELLVTLLGHRGHQTFEAIDGADGLARARSIRPDLVISDILMPTMDGFEFVRRLREEPKLGRTHVIFHTAHFREIEARNLAASCGVSRILLKPSDPEEMLAVIEASLAEAVSDGGGATRPTEEGFERQHLRLVTDKLAENELALRATNHRLSALTDLNVQLASKKEPGLLLESLCRSSRDLLGARYTVLCAKSKQEPGRAHWFTSGIADDVARGLAAPALDEGMYGALLADRIPVRQSGLGGDPRRAGLPAGYPSADNMLAAPISSLHNVYGWVCAVDKVGAAAFDDDDEHILSVLAAQVGRIYENGSLYSELARDAERLEGEIAERKRIEHALRESEHKYRQLIEQASDGIYLMDHRGAFVLANSVFCSMLGWTPAELIGQSGRVTYVDADLPLFDKRLAKIQRVRGGLVERWMRRRDGSAFAAEISVHRLDDGMIQGIVRDVTARKQAEAALAESEQRFRQLAENIHEVFWLTDPTKNEMLYVSVGSPGTELEFAL